MQQQQLKQNNVILTTTTNTSNQNTAPIQNNSTQRIQINNNQFIKSLPASFRSSSVIGLSFRGKKSGHIIAIQAIKNYRLELICYKIFDPNIGEFDCSRSERKIIC